MISTWLQDLTLIAAILAIFAPFLSFLLIMVFTRPHPRISGGLSVSAVGISLVGATFLLVRHWHLEHPIQYSVRWLVSGDIFVPFGFLLDPLSLFMLFLVAMISFLVQVYSLGYMAADPGFSRYYAFQSLFAWSMMTLSIAPTMLQLYAFWELVGLSSYLLIGFWYERFSATQAGKKAFVMTRLGDVALFLGLLLLLLNLGNLNVLYMNSAELTARMSDPLMTLAALLIFGGVVGKSAQFPLLTWLPDAMEGPTPVSALLHSATMVAADVYLFARLFPFLSHSEGAMFVFVAIGTISMLLAATMAIVSRDIKKVWAYSTISQLGFMIMGLAAGGYFAGVFHLSTHAVFKALLFLCSGVWVHQYGTNDIFEISRRGARVLKTPTICIVLAAAALSGLPPLSGFFSKEAIMAVLAGLGSPIWSTAGFLGVFLTAYYAFRLIFILIFPRERERSEDEGGIGGRRGGDAVHRRERIRYRLMAWPLVILACISVLIGFFREALEEFLMQFSAVESSHEPHAWLFYATVGLAVFAVGLAWFEFGRRGSPQVGFVERIPALRTLFAERWYLDHAYRRLVDYLVDGVFSNLSVRNERRIIDDSIDKFCRLVVSSGRNLSFLQSGLLRYNLAVMLTALGLVALYFFFS